MIKDSKLYEFYQQGIFEVDILRVVIRLIDRFRFSYVETAYF